MQNWVRCSWACRMFTFQTECTMTSLATLHLAQLVGLNELNHECGVTGKPGLEVFRAVTALLSSQSDEPTRFPRSRDHSQKLPSLSTDLPGGRLCKRLR